MALVALAIIPSAVEMAFTATKEKLCAFVTSLNDHEKKTGLNYRK